jgi:mannose-1-phosphate guanylyltransferase
MLVLAGGIGSRFWPVSTPARPKQLLPLAGDQPLIVDTVERARSMVPDERLRVLAGAHLMAPFGQAIPDLPDESYLVEPAMRGTCPVLAWAAWQIARVDPEAVLVSLHADHLIRPLDAFRDTVEAAVHVARKEELLLTVGVAPDRVETGFGHIAPGRAVPCPGGHDAFRVDAFHEKPDAATAERYVADGYLWNTGIFVWKAGTFLDELGRHAPEVADHLPLLEEGPEAFFEATPVCVVDKAVLERSDRVGCIRATFEWDDVGSWEALGRWTAGDATGNVVVGDGRVVDGTNNIVFADDGSVVLFGVHDLVVVNTGDKALVLPRARAAEMKTLLAALEENE